MRNLRGEPVRAARVFVLLQDYFIKKLKPDRKQMNFLCLIKAAFIYCFIMIFFFFCIIYTFCLKAGLCCVAARRDVVLALIDLPPYIMGRAARYSAYSLYLAFALYISSRRLPTHLVYQLIKSGCWIDGTRADISVPFSIIVKSEFVISRVYICVCR